MADTIVIETPVATVLEVSGLQGPQGPQGPKGDPGDVAGSIDWSGITGKPSTFTPSAHTHPTSDVTGFAAAAAAAAPVQSVNGQTGAVTVSIPTASAATPSALGPASAGSSANFARADHVHAMPTAAATGAVTIQSRETISMNSSPATTRGGSWDNDTLLLPNSRNTLYYFSSSWNTPASRNIRLPSNNCQTGDTIRFETNFLPANSSLSFYVFSPGPGWALQDSWVNGTASGLYYQFAATFVCLDGASASWQMEGRQWQITAPQTPTSQGVSGQLAYKDPYLYVCVNQNVWRRVPVAAW